MTDITHWHDCLRAFLHDPPDKALSVKDHENRARTYQNAAFDVPGDAVRAGTVKGGDWLASAIERLPLPKGSLTEDGRSQRQGGTPLPDHQQPFNRLDRDALQRVHPVSGRDITDSTCVFRAAKSLEDGALEERAEVIRSIAQANPDPRLRAYALWRLLPERLPKVADLPGDTRLRDHSIIDHLDACAAATAALRPQTEGGAQAADLLVFSLGPVQDFIVKGRSLRDLWTGSYLLSWLTFQAMVPLLEELGPWAITSPGLRGNPLCDWWLGEAGVRETTRDSACYLGREPGAKHPQATLTEELRRDLRWAGLPNTFTALVPRARSEALRKACAEACARGWRQIQVAVHQRLLEAWKDVHAGQDWDLDWDEQCDQVWDIRAVTLPFAELQQHGTYQDGQPRYRLASDVIAGEQDAIYATLVGEIPASVEAARRLAEALDQQRWLPGYAPPAQQGLWTLANDLAQRVLAADKTARRVPPPAPEDDTREKCALFPGFAVMGPNGDTAANKRWWRRVAAMGLKLPGRISANERLSAPGLVKRLAFGAYFRAQLGKDDFPDTREAAFGWWIERFQKTVADGKPLWQEWLKKTKDINRRAEDELEQPWTAHELLDEGRLSVPVWEHEAADAKVLRPELDRARRARQRLIAAAKDAGLPEPRPYYAVLCADGDKMGSYLRGEKGPSFAQAYHPVMAAALRDSCGATTDILETVRPQGLAAQLTFSSCLNVFTREAARAVEKHQGTCVYAGGDDVLAVLPVQTALECAARLAGLFKREVDGATLSAGIAIVHCSDDLKVAIEEARGAERHAKNSGRDGLSLRIVRRSGDTTEAYCPWLQHGEERDEVDQATGVTRKRWQQTQNLVHDWFKIAGLLAGQSDRWVHHALAEREELQAVAAISLDPVWRRVRHLLLHGEEGQRRAADLGKLFDRLAEVWASDSTELKKRAGFATLIKQRGESAAKAWLVDQFLTWCQHAAWLSRFLPRPEGKR